MSGASLQENEASDGAGAGVVQISASNKDLIAEEATQDEAASSFATSKNEGEGVTPIRTQQRNGRKDSAAAGVVQNLNQSDPFSQEASLDEEFEDKESASFASTKREAADIVHIRIQQRNGRKTLTTLQGLSSSYDPKKVLKAAKKEFACNGSLVTDPEYGEVIQLQGDQRAALQTLLTEEGIVDKAKIKVHGF